MHRTPDTYRNHLETTVQRCATTWMVLATDQILGTEYLLLPKLCKSNYCTYCRQQNLRRLRQSLYLSLHHHRWRLITLTYPDHTQDKLEQLRNTARQFKRLIQRLKRRYPRLAYVRTIELHQSDYPHLHMIVDRYIPKAALTKHWHDLGGGITDIHAYRKCKVCGIRGKCQHNPKPRPLSYRDAAHYLTEEIEKAQQDPHRLGEIYWCASVRSLSTSRNLQLRPPTSSWKFIGLWPDVTDAWNFINDLHQFTDPHKLNPLIEHDLKDGLLLGYGLKQSV